MVATALLMIVFGLPFAAASVPVAPPMDLAATMTPDGIELTWSPPVGSTAGVTYAVYRDGVLLEGAVEGLSYVDTTSSASFSSGAASTTFYAVTAITDLGESLPALTAFLDGCINQYPGQVPPVTIDPIACTGGGP